MKNEGHGHVFPRPDGVRARCGGPGICLECSSDAAARGVGQNDIYLQQKQYIEEQEAEVIRCHKRIAELEAVCKALVENSTHEDGDGETVCSICGESIRDNFGETASEVLAASADHEDWCPLPMAFKALKGEG